MTTVRPLSAEDRELWQPLWEGYLRFYRAELAPAVTEATFARLSGADPALVGLVAVDAKDQPVGLAHLVFHASTWSTQQRCYLNDLFVARSARGSGTGQALIQATYERAAARGADEVYWHTQEFNFAARSLYDTLAALTSFRVYEHEL